MFPVPMLILLFALVGVTASDSDAVDCGELSTCDECISQECSWNLKRESCGMRSGFDFLNHCKVSAKSDCPWKIEEKYAYNDSFARYVMFRLAGAANTDEPQYCLSKISSDVKLYNQILINCTDKYSTCSAMTAIWHRKNAILVAFRSSTSATQLVAQFVSGIVGTTPVEGGGKVATYYKKIFREVWDAGLHRDVDYLVHSYPDYELYLSGDSQAATLATIAAHVMVAKNIISGEKIKLITFGEPRVYDREFSEVHDRMLPYSYRVVRGRDAIPHLAPKEHMNYRHHRYEVWYNNNMKPKDTYKICLSPEDCRCSNSLSNFELLQHWGYFGVDPFTFMDTDCDLP